MNPSVDFIALPDGRRLRQVRLFISQPQLRPEPFEAVVSVRRLMELAKTYRDGAARADLAARSYGRGMGKEEWYKTFLNPNPNEEECAFCRARVTCPAAIEKVRSTIIPFGAIEELPEVKPAKRGESAEAKAERREQAEKFVPRDLRALNTAMKAAGFVEDWVLAVRAEAERVMLAGGELEDFGLELGRKGNRTFADPEKATELLRKKFRLRLEDCFNLKLKTPTQLEALTKPLTLEDGTVEPPPLGEKRWAQICALVTQGDPKPSVKPKAVIKTPYKPEATQAFDAVADDSEDDEPMW